MTEPTTETAPDAEPIEDQQTEPETEQTEEPTVEPETEPETFPAAYVKELRDENKTRRLEAKEATDRAEDLAKRLHTALVTATGRLADPTDLPYNPEHLDAPDKLTAAVDALLAAKPHLASRRPTGSIGQGESGGGGSVDLAALLRSRA